MTSRPRFPLGLTFAVALVVAICCALGAWQLQRAAWKRHVLAEISERRVAAARPIGTVLRLGLEGGDAGFTRVTASCAGRGAQTFKPLNEGGEWVWRVLADCGLLGGPYSSIEVDRGVLDSSRGSTTAPTVALPPPVEVVGVLLPAPSRRVASPSSQAPYILVADSERPPAPGVTPAPFSGRAPASFQYVGAYAPTWFGLAGVALCVYAAMLFRRYRPKA